jgi:MFS family permease
MGLPNLVAAANPTRVRLGVLAFACSLALLTYLDRVCISRVQEDIERELRLSEFQMGLVFGAFAIGYGLFEVPGGWMGDVWGPRRVLTRIVLWWSAFTALTGCIWWFTLDSGYELAFFGWTVPLVLNSFLVMLLVRFLFGCGEAGAFPNLTRVVGSWFPYQERGVAQGAIWMCARLGGAVAPLLVGLLTEAFGWRQAFWVLGLIGVVWCVFFFGWFRDRPEDKPSCNQPERDLIRAGPYSWKADEAAGAHPQAPWGRLLASPTLWALCVASAGVSFAWYFFPTWQPKYFKDVFQLDFKNSEWLTALPFLCGAFGALAGGRLSDLLIQLTGSRRWGRSLVGVFGFVGAGTCMLCMGLTTQPWHAVTLLCLAFFINDLAIPPIWAASADIGGRYAGTVSGVMNMAGCIGSFLGPVLTPVLLAAFPQDLSLGTRWVLTFAVYAGAWFVAALAWLLVDASRPIVPEPPPATTTEPAQS